MDHLTVKLWKEKEFKAYINLPIKIPPPPVSLSALLLHFYGILYLASPEIILSWPLTRPITSYSPCLSGDRGQAWQGRGGCVVGGWWGSGLADDLLWWLLERSVVSSLILEDYRKWYVREEVWFIEKGLFALSLCFWCCRTVWKTGLN